jgi:hypothetical protein
MSEIPLVDLCLQHYMRLVFVTLQAARSAPYKKAVPCGKTGVQIESGYHSALASFGIMWRSGVFLVHERRLCRDYRPRPDHPAYGRYRIKQSFATWPDTLPGYT